MSVMSCLSQHLFRSVCASKEYKTSSKLRHYLVVDSWILNSIQRFHTQNEMVNENLDYCRNYQ